MYLDSKNKQQYNLWFHYYILTREELAILSYFSTRLFRALIFCCWTL